MRLKLDHWSCNPFGFEREINVLLCKDDFPREMLLVSGHAGFHLSNISPNVFDKEQISHSPRLVLRSWRERDNKSKKVKASLEFRPL